MELRRVDPEETFAMSTSEGLVAGSAGDSPPSVRIPADGWELELTLEQDLVSLRLFSRKKNIPVGGIRVGIAPKDRPRSEALTDPDGRLSLPLESGGSKITIHANPPFVLDFQFPVES